MANPDIYWEGKSGEKYGYWIYKLSTTFKDEPGNYIYAKETSANRWTPIYNGQTSSLQDRLANHEKESCAKRNGATHIHAHLTPGSETNRTSEEYDLIAKWKPICNES